MAYSYKGSISFGLVYVPVTLHASVKEGAVGFHMLDRKTMSRVKYKKTCVDCGDREVKQEDIVKGFEYEEGKYVVFEEDDFEKIKTEKDRNITIEQFVDLKEIDPIFFDKPYYVVPTGAEKAFAVLVKAMDEEEKAGIAKTVLGTKETLVAVRVRGGQMLLNTLYFAEEIQKNPAHDADGNVPEKELNIAKAIIGGMTEPFDIGKYRDEYREKIRAAIEKKIAGKEIVKEKAAREGSVGDLMDALTVTLRKLEKPKGKKEEVKIKTKSAAKRKNA